MKLLSYLTVLVLICVFVLTGCRLVSTDDIGADSGTPTFVQKSFPDAPPMLTVVYGEEQITAWRGTYSWETFNALGIGQAVQADSMHPLDDLTEIPVLTVDDDAVFSFDAAPDDITVRRYPLDGMVSYDTYETIIVDGSGLSLPDGAALYEVIAEWNKKNETYSGDAYYAFRTE